MQILATTTWRLIRASYQHRALLALVLILVSLLAGPVPSPAEELHYLEEITTEEDFLTVTRVETRQSYGWTRVGNFVTPASDDPSLLPTIYINVNLHPVHRESLSQLFPERFAGLTSDDYAALVMYRYSRQYYAGKICKIEDPFSGVMYGFEVYYDFSHRGEQLSMKEVRQLYLQLAETFHLRPFVYSPVFPPSVYEAEHWESPDFPIYFYKDELQRDYVPYTQATSYGRIRLVTAGDTAESEGMFSWQDILVFDMAPIDIQDVVAGVITGTPQGELSHLAIRMARRGKPNAYVRNAHDAYTDLEGALVRLTIGPDSVTIDPDISAEDALAWWQANRPLLARVTQPDLRHSTITDLLDMETGSEDASLLAARFGGKAANLARLYEFLPAQHQVPGFAIPCRYYQEFMRSNQISDDRFDPPVQRTYEEYLQELFVDPRFLSDAAYRSWRLQELREHAEDHGEVDPTLVAMVGSRIEEVFGSGEVMVRFRSSSNVEDALVFNGAGLYSSTSVCAADSWDGDDDGPSRCWQPQEDERTITRGLKRVWTSLWNYRAFEERSYFQVPPDAVAMAILVTPAFPDEAANGVAFTGLPGVQLGKGLRKGAETWPQSPSTYLVNVQAGDASVVSPDPGVLAERDLLTLNEGLVQQITRSHPSSLVPAGSWVLSEQQLATLGAVMWLVDRDMPLDLQGYSRQQVLLDMEFKLSQQGELLIKQVRPFLDSSLAPPTVADYYRLEVPAGTTLCALPSEERGDIRQEYALLAQVDLYPGTIYLPRSGDPVEADLIAELRFGPQHKVAQPQGRGRFRPVAADTGITWVFEQGFTTAGDNLSLSVHLPGLSFASDTPSLLLDDAALTFHKQAYAVLGQAKSGELRLGPCSCGLLPEYRLEVELEDATSARLDLRALEDDPANLVGADVVINGTTIRQNDYWHLVSAAGPAQSSRQLWVLFSAPIDRIYGLALYEETPSLLRAAYLDRNLDELQPVGVAHHLFSDLVPSFDTATQSLQSYVIPVAAHTSGYNDTRWVSDLVLQPRDVADPGSAFLYLLPGPSAEPEVPSGASERLLSLPAAGSLLLGDVLRNQLGYLDQTGALVIASETPLLLGARTYNSTPLGSYGQYVPPVPMSNALSGDDQAVLIQLTSTSAYRSNISLVNLAPAYLLAEIELYAADGTLLGSRTQRVPRYGYRQAARVFAALGSQPVEDGFAVVRALTDSPRFLVCASVVDEVSGDPVLVAPSQPLAGVSYVLAAANAAGANDTAWHTDLELYNPGDAPVSAGIEFIGTAAESQPVAQEVTVPARSALRSIDVVGQLLGYQGAGALRITPHSGALHVSSRTYNDLGGSTYGQHIPGIAEEEALVTGDAARLVQLSHSPDGSTGSRSNIGLINISDTEIVVKVELFDETGESLGVLHRTLPPRSYHQESNVFATVTESPIAAGSAMITSSTPGARFFVYASVVDNRSGDPIFMPAGRL